jgi:hypothetical protein
MPVTPRYSSYYFTILRRALQEKAGSARPISEPHIHTKRLCARRKNDCAIPDQTKTEPPFGSSVSFFTVTS